VNLSDFATFRAAFGKSLGGVGFREELDFNGNGVIDLLDFANFRGSFGKSVNF
jgi:hypothetical protein